MIASRYTYRTGPAVELPGAMRWIERRVRLVHHVVSIVGDVSTTAIYTTAIGAQARELVARVWP